MAATAVILVAVLSAAVCSDIVYVSRLPQELAASAFGDVRIGAARGHNDGGKLIFKLFGLFPIKSIDVRTAEDVYIGGTPVGLSLRSNGVIVEEIGTVATSAGEVSARTNVLKGDIIVEAGGTVVSDVVGLAKAVRAADASCDLPLVVLRGGGRVKAAITPMYEHLSGQLRIGLWLKDKVNGIGTMSFIKKDGAFGALGHAITAGETVVPISGGELKTCKILGFTKGRRGVPGEIKGLIKNEAKGSLKDNTAYGVFGDLYDAPSGELYQVGSRLDVTTGEAKMYTTIDDKTDFYDIEIIRALPQSKRSDKSMVIRVTDKRLIEKTGGIIQGMSGSPIVQNGKLVGAVTHVFINDPTKGYGIYLDWMY